MTLCDFACCGGYLNICKMILNKGFQFTSQSLQFSIRYHRNEVFDWLVNELNISMDKECYKASIKFKYITGIELYQGNYDQINVNLELSKSGNYVLFCKFIKPELIYTFNNKNKTPLYRKKYAPIIPIFYYNSVDCYRYIFSKKLDLNECSWFDSLNGPFRFVIPPDKTHIQYINPFHIAIKHQFIDLLKMILIFGVIDLNSVETLSTAGGVGTLCLFNGKALPPLEIAINTDNSDLVQFLLSIEEIDVNKAPSNGGGSSYSMGRSNRSMLSSIIRQAALRGNLEILEILLKSPRIDKNSICHVHSYGSGYSSFNKDENKEIEKIQTISIYTTTNKARVISKKKIDDTYQIDPTINKFEINLFSKGNNKSEEISKIKNTIDMMIKSIDTKVNISKHQLAYFSIIRYLLGEKDDQIKEQFKNIICSQEDAISLLNTEFHDFAIEYLSENFLALIQSHQLINLTKEIVFEIIDSFFIRYSKKDDKQNSTEITKIYEALK